MGALETCLCFGCAASTARSLAEACLLGKKGAYQRVLRSMWLGSAATRFNQAETAG
jgi:hypothetical protein